MSIRIIPCVIIALILSACHNKEPRAIVIPLTAEMEVEWRAE
jgi:outer membrane PBP1 activator LpoA protein